MSRILPPGEWEAYTHGREARRNEIAQQTQETADTAEAERKARQQASAALNQQYAKRLLAAREFQQAVTANLSYARQALQRALAEHDIEAAVTAQTRVSALEALQATASRYAERPY